MCINGAGKESSGGERGWIKKLVFGGVDGNQIQ